MIIMKALLENNENSRTPKFEKSPKIWNLRKFKHAKITRSTVYDIRVYIVSIVDIWDMIEWLEL